MIYFDHNATTPLDERVVDAMLPYLRRYYGNPSSLHRLGRLSRGAIDGAREQVAALVGARAAEVIFTSGGTEANNLALKGMAAALAPGDIISGATEHPAVTEPLRCLGRRGWSLRILPVDDQGLIESSALQGLVSRRTRFGTLMLANNETGVIHDPRPLAESLRCVDAYLHIDAVQAVGKIPVNFAETGASTMALSSHKLHGPKGVGALVADRRVPLEPLLRGGGQEQDRRGGTENVAGIVGFGKAAELARLELEERRRYTRVLRMKLEEGLRALPGLTLFAETVERLPNTLLFSIPGYDGETLAMQLDRLGIAVSSGSACASGGNEPSPVLLAMGVNEVTARGAIRVSLGHGNSAPEVDRFIEAIQGFITVH